MITELSRREFTKLTVAAGFSQPAPQGAKTFPSIGIQGGRVSFPDEVIKAVLDRFQQDSDANALFIATISFGRDIAGRRDADFFEGHPVARKCVPYRPAPLLSPCASRGLATVASRMRDIQS